MKRAWPLCLVFVIGCGDDTIEDVDPGFAATSADVCETRTSSVRLTTANGGWLTLEVRDRCGRSAGTCTGADAYAAGARGAVRIAAGSVFLDDCAIVATPGAMLLATFRRADAGTVSERYELSLIGACGVDAGATMGCTPDAGTPSIDAATP